jgi:hypothetical protein
MAVWSSKRSVFPRLACAQGRPEGSLIKGPAPGDTISSLSNGEISRLRRLGVLVDVPPRQVVELDDSGVMIIVLET